MHVVFLPSPQTPPLTTIPHAPHAPHHTPMPQREGPGGFYKGLVPNVVRVMPQSAITFLVRGCCSGEGRQRLLVDKVWCGVQPPVAGF